jgi:regulatory protein
MSELMSELLSGIDATTAVIDPADIRLAAMNLLARREHSVWELRRKLRIRFPDDALLDEQLSRLAEQNLQSDMRFAESYIRQRIHRGYGPVRLREELRERGISRADIAQLMDELEIDWRAHALQVMQNKYGEFPPCDLREEARRARFMQHRGFTAEHFRNSKQD